MIHKMIHEVHVRNLLTILLNTISVFSIGNCFRLFSAHTLFLLNLMTFKSNLFFRWVFVIKHTHTIVCCMYEQSMYEHSSRRTVYYNNKVTINQSILVTVFVRYGLTVFTLHIITANKPVNWLCAYLARYSLVDLIY